MLSQSTPITIDFTTLNQEPAHQAYLSQLLEENRQKNLYIIKFGTHVIVVGEGSEKQKVELVLTNTLLALGKDDDGNDHYSVCSGQLLGKGALGEVFASDQSIHCKGKCVEVKKAYNAVKFISGETILANTPTTPRGIRQSREKKTQKAQEEARLQNGCLKVLAAIPSDSWMILVMERFKGESLDTVLEKLRKSGKKLCWEQRLILSLNILHEFRNMHSNKPERKPIVHGDIKPANIMVDLETLEVRIIDLGMGVYLGQKRFGGGTPDYVAPELFDTEQITIESDIYALSAVLADILSGGFYELIMGPKRKAMDARKTGKEVANIPFDFDLVSLHFPDSLQDEFDKLCLQKFLSRMSDPNPNKRPDHQKIYEFFNKLYQATMQKRSKLITELRSLSQNLEDMPVSREISEKLQQVLASAASQSSPKSTTESKSPESKGTPEIKAPEPSPTYASVTSQLAQAEDVQKEKRDETKDRGDSKSMGPAQGSGKVMRRCTLSEEQISALKKKRMNLTLTGDNLFELKTQATKQLEKYQILAKQLTLLREKGFKLEEADYVLCPQLLLKSMQRHIHPDHYNIAAFTNLKRGYLFETLGSSFKYLNQWFQELTQCSSKPQGHDHLRGICEDLDRKEQKDPKKSDSVLLILALRDDTTPHAIVRFQAEQKVDALAPISELKPTATITPLLRKLSVLLQSHEFLPLTFKLAEVDTVVQVDNLAREILQVAADYQQLIFLVPQLLSKKFGAVESAGVKQVREIAGKKELSILEKFAHLFQAAKQYHSKSQTPDQNPELRKFFDELMLMKDKDLSTTVMMMNLTTQLPAGSAQYTEPRFIAGS